MSFHVEPKSGAAVASSQPNAQTAADAKARAVALLMGQEAGQSAPVQNPTSISAEEAGAVKASEPEVQEDNNEVPAEAPKETKAEDPLSTQYAVLARKEKALRAKSVAQEQSLKAREAALIAREEAIKAKDSEYSTNYIQKDRLAKDPLSVLSEAGMDYDQLTQLILNQPQQDPQTRALFDKLQAKIDALEAAQESATKGQASQQQQQYQQAVKQIRMEAQSLVNSDEAFETIKETGSVGDVVDLIERTFKEDGILLSVEEAATEVESYLLEEAMKLTKLKKIQQRMQPTQSSAAQKSPELAAKQPQMKTLTNSHGATRQLTAKERAVLAFKGELK